MTPKTAIIALTATSVLAFGAGTALSSGRNSSPAASGQMTSQGSQQSQGGMHGRGGQHGQGRMHGQGAGTSTATASKLTLTSDGKAELLYMREEEKLAQDVYTTLAKQYPNAPFSQITRSEATHASAIQRQLDRAGIDDPTIGNGVGVFENDDLQKLYDTLVAQGSKSLRDALTVGALIEETDIADLRTSAKTTKDAQLLRVYANLERASGQHLRVFTSQLKAAGVTYDPTVLSQADVDEILSSTMHR